MIDLCIDWFENREMALMKRNQSYDHPLIVVLRGPARQSEGETFTKTAQGVVRWNRCRRMVLHVRRRRCYSLPIVSVAVAAVEVTWRHFCNCSQSSTGWWRRFDRCRTTVASCITRQPIHFGLVCRFNATRPRTTEETKQNKAKPNKTKQYKKRLDVSLIVMFRFFKDSFICPWPVSTTYIE